MSRENVWPRGHLPLCHHVPDQGHQVGGGAGQDQSPCLQARHIEQVLGEFIQARGRLINLLEGFLLPGGQFRAFAARRLVHQHLGKAFEHGEGVAQLVGSHPDKLVLEVLGFLECAHVLIDDQRN